MPGKTLQPRPSCPLLLRPLRVLYYCTSPFGWRPPLLARPCCCSIRTRWQRANCILDQGICHCRAYHAPLGLPRSAVWRALHRRHAGKLPYSLLCRPTGWTASFEGCAPHNAIRKPLIAQLAQLHRMSSSPETLTRNSISRQAVNSARRCFRWRGP
jgi:hypothetical protein